MSSALTQPPARSVRLSHEEILRYSRHLILQEVGPEGQRRLKGARVALIEAGGLGSPAAFYTRCGGGGDDGPGGFRRSRSEQLAAASHSRYCHGGKERLSSNWERCRPHSALSTDTRAS